MRLLSTPDVKAQRMTLSQVRIVWRDNQGGRTSCKLPDLLNEVMARISIVDLLSQSRLAEIGLTAVWPPVLGQVWVT